MTGEMIELLAKSCKHRYIIPFDQRLSNVKSLILWNSHNREGAEDESDNLVRALKRIDGCVDAVEWCEWDHLKKTIQGKLHDIKTSKECSLLIVAIMSHGKMGMIYDKDDIGLPIDDIILQLHRGLPSHIPLVSGKSHDDWHY